MREHGGGGERSEHGDVGPLRQSFGQPPPRFREELPRLDVATRRVLDSVQRALT